jgi:hypothetical protein
VNGERRTANGERRTVNGESTFSTPVASQDTVAQPTTGPVNPLASSSETGSRIKRHKPEPKNIASSIRVRVNTKTGIYHYPGTKWYGHTKEGKYISEQAAIKEVHEHA